MSALGQLLSALSPDVLSVGTPVEAEFEDAVKDKVDRDASGGAVPQPGSDVGRRVTSPASPCVEQPSL